ncbi:MAG TPA: hypothetical protein VE944_32830 [Nostoc sp.]|uniref:hypothetical protein n=1 Tax=Nostoc sp. TaxID=1180 RepID=UPI002D5BD6F1|nr:hypothetical protein [Nostoc sp.]HYX19054.1 hypothetical protein [Nostoc sp.]
MTNVGWVEIEQEQLKPLRASTATIYRWLAEGKQRGFFWHSTWRNGKLFVKLGGLYRVSKFLKIKSWGVVAQIPLSMLLVSNGRRMVASAITAQDLQERSRYAANKQRSQLERKCFDFPTVDHLMNQDQTSLQMNRGGIRGLIHRGQKRIFVGRRFVPFGTSQPTIAKNLTAGPVSCGLSRWTVRRHLDKLEVDKRQIMQAKPEYKEIYTRINQGATSWQCKSQSDISFSWQDTGVIRIYEPNGDSSARREGGHPINLDRLNKYQKVIWLPRCNIYDLDFQLTSMKYARYKWKQSLLAYERSLSTVTEQPGIVPVENFVSPLDPPQEDKLPACSLRSAGSGQNKGSNFENPEKTDCEPVLEDSAKECWLDAGAKLRALVAARKAQKLERLRNL